MPITTPIVVWGCIAVLGLYAFYAYAKYGKEGSVSTYVRSVSKTFMIIVFLFGVLAGHFWFCDCTNSPECKTAEKK